MARLRDHRLWMMGIGFAALLAISVGAGASGALNMWYDADIDALMSRTAKRPIPSGLILPSDATIEVTRDGAGVDAGLPDARLDRQVALYETGLDDGHFAFHIPATPQIDTSALDADDLAGISGGMYCCCCPCCCCG